MAKWNNFSIWKGRLPHWRADDVHYFVKFRHRRELDDHEINILFTKLIAAQISKLDFQILCVLPEETQCIFSVVKNHDGSENEFADLFEKAKRKAGKSIIKKSGEKWPPFYLESFDRIIRDEGEFEEFWLNILALPVDAGLVAEPEDWHGSFVVDHAVT